MYGEERFFFNRHDELLVAEGVLPEVYPRVLEPETAIHGTDLGGHVVQPGDQLVAAFGEGRSREFRIIPLKTMGVFLKTDSRSDRGVITPEGDFINLCQDYGPRYSVDKLIANFLLSTNKEAEMLAERVGRWQKLLNQFENNGLTGVWIKDRHPSFAPKVEPLERLFSKDGNIRQAA